MSPENYPIVALLCFGIAVIIFVAEVFIPSGGLLGLLAAISTVAGIVLMFLTDQTMGAVSMFVVLALLPILIMVMLRWAPETPIAKMLTLSTEQRSGYAPSADPSNPGGATKPRLVGKTGKALHDLRPVGTCLIDGERYECLAVRGVIEADTPIKVVSEDGMDIKVMPEDA